MRIFKTFYLIPQSIHLFLTVLADIVDVWQCINQFSFLENRFEHFLCVNVFQSTFFPGSKRVKDSNGDWIFSVELFIMDADIIRNCFAVFIKEAVYLLKVRVGNLFCTFAYLNLRDKFSVLFHCNQLINAAKYRVRFAGNQSFTDTEAVDLCTLNLKITDNIFIQRVGSNNLNIGISCCIQHFSCLFGQVRNIAAVDADALRTISLWNYHFIKYFDCVWNTGF